MFRVASLAFAAAALLAATCHATTLQEVLAARDAALLASNQAAGKSGQGRYIDAQDAANEADVLWIAYLGQDPDPENAMPGDHYGPGTPQECKALRDAAYQFYWDGNGATDAGDIHLAIGQTRFDEREELFEEGDRTTNPDIKSLLYYNAVVKYQAAQSQAEAAEEMYDEGIADYEAAIAAAQEACIAMGEVCSIQW